ncbi:TFIIS N-terminal domain-containing protein [Durusdinium trenchii]|uniref:TFIIS N-terminal domain-containing protein n=1 Tax=Durusdinium trenchii TaxID=1381693 RepID=A0ABP0HBH8_9DINO
MLLARLLNRYLPFLHQLLEGIVLPGSNNSPYGHHNQVQVAVKRPGFEGYTDLARMSSSRVGHIDQSSAKQTPPGKPTSNYSVLFGVVLSGETKTRSDAGNLYLAPGSYQKLAKAFQAFQGKVPWHPNITEHYLGEEDPKMEAVRASPGEAILMHHQTVHGVGPNHSNTDRVNVYFRITASGRPDGLKTSYPKAMQEPLLETPLLQTLAGAE